jgi:hypothetical protein
LYGKVFWGRGREGTGEGVFLGLGWILHLTQRPRGEEVVVGEGGQGVDDIPGFGFWVFWSEYFIWFMGSDEVGVGGRWGGEGGWFGSKRTEKRKAEREVGAMEYVAVGGAWVKKEECCS